MGIFFIIFSVTILFITYFHFVSYGGEVQDSFFLQEFLIRNRARCAPCLADNLFWKHFYCFTQFSVFDR